MQIKYGYKIGLSCLQPTPAVCLMDVHPDRHFDIEHETPIATSPTVTIASYIDAFGNQCRRFVVPAGEFSLQLQGVIRDQGLHDPVVPHAVQHDIADLPCDTLHYLMGSRYCETDMLSQTAWHLFGRTPENWSRVQEICNFVHGHLTFDYNRARATRTALEAFNERVGVCRDFAHLAITLCRCMNIPARYVNGYLGDIGVPAAPAPMDFSAWFEVFLGGRWYTFDARHNVPRQGRIVIARGRDAMDVPLINTFGLHTLTSFKVWADEVSTAPTVDAASRATRTQSGVEWPGQPRIATRHDVVWPGENAEQSKTCVVVITSRAGVEPIARLRVE